VTHGRAGVGLTDDEWELALHFREVLGLTYAQVARVVGYSPSRVKQKALDYAAYQSPSGGWTYGPRRAKCSTEPS